MKSLIFSLVLPFLSLLTAQAQEEAVAKTLIESVQDVNSIKKEVSIVGAVERPCPSCDGDSRYNFTVKADNKEIDLDKKLFFVKDNSPINILVQRDQNSPKKITIQFKNPYRVCGKHYVGPSMIPGGSIMVDCIFYVTDFEEQSIDVDLSKYPVPLEGATDTLVLSIKKSDITRTKYSVDAFYNGADKATVDIDSKFFGRGRNVVVRKPAGQ
jgi:hypothetical protein